MADIAEEAALQPDDAVPAAAGKLMCYLWGVAWQHAPATTAGDADALHDMRVAVRRLRSAMQNFEGPKSAPLLGKRLHRELAKERRVLGKLGDVLGAVRDHDVLDDYLKQYAKTRLKKEVSQSPGLAHFENFLQAERAHAFAPMTKRINRVQKPGRLREQFARYALGFSAASVPVSAPKTLSDAARRILPQRIDEVMSHAPALQDDDDAEGHHEFRKSLKRLRYSLEFFAPCFAAPIKSHLKTFTKLQDRLGEMNDRHVLRQRAEEAFHNGVTEYSIKSRKASPDDADDAPFPSDIAVFLHYGDERSTRLLQQVRAQWSELQEGGWPVSLLTLLGSDESVPAAEVVLGELPDAATEDSAEVDSACDSET